MSQAYLTEQERIDQETMKIDKPNRVVGSGYIQFPPQVPFSQPIHRQPPTITKHGENTKIEQGVHSQNAQPYTSVQRLPQQSPPSHAAPRARQTWREPVAQPQTAVSRPLAQAVGHHRMQGASAQPAAPAYGQPAASPRARQAPPGPTQQRPGANLAPPNGRSFPMQPAQPQKDTDVRLSQPPAPAAGESVGQEEKEGGNLSKSQAKRLRKKLREGKA